MRYVLATIFVCTVGMPAASALPTVSPNSLSASNADPMVQEVRRNRPHSGYEGDPATLPDNLKQRDLTPRQRKPLKEFVFTGKWGNPAPFLAKR